jgi:hypothetical protein
MAGDGAQGWVDCDYVRDLAEGYALDAVDPLERERIAAHLAACADCRKLIAELRGVVAFLPFLGIGGGIGDAVEDRPSANAKAAFMARVRGWQTFVPAPPRQPTVATRPVAAPQAAFIERAERFHPALSVVPMAAAVVLALVWSFSLQNQLNQTEDQLDDTQQAGVASLLGASAGQSQMYSFTPMCASCGFGGKLKADAHRNVVVLYAWALDPSVEHQVWIQGGNDRWERVRVLNVSDSGECMEVLQLDRPLSAYQALVISSVSEDDPNSAATPELMVQPIAAVPPAGAMMLAS